MLRGGGLRGRMRGGGDFFVRGFELEFDVGLRFDWRGLVLFHLGLRCRGRVKRG